MNGDGSAVQHRVVDPRSNGHWMQSWRSAARQHLDALVAISYDELEQRLRSGRNIAWAGRPMQEDGTWPAHTYFFVTKAGDRTRIGRRFRVVPPEDAGLFVAQLKAGIGGRKSGAIPYEPYVQERHPNNVKLRKARNWTDLRDRGFSGAVAVLLVAMFLLMVPGGARAAGWSPVSPNPSSLQAISAEQAIPASPNHFILGETFAFNQSYVPATTSGCAGTCHIILPGWSNLSVSSQSVPSGAYLAASPTPYVTLIRTNFCQIQSGLNYCTNGPYFICDGHNLTPPVTGDPCYTLQIGFAGGKESHSTPTYVLERVLTWIWPYVSPWSINPCAAGSVTGPVWDFGPGFLNSEAVNRITTWSTLSATWIIPLPSGYGWEGPTTSIEDLNSTTILSSTQYFVGNSYLLLQWQGLPTPAFGLTPEPYANNISRTYQAIILISCGGGSSGGNGNFTAPNGLPGPALPPATIVLLLGNTTTINAGNLSSSVTWFNRATTTFLGSFVLEGTFLTGATGVRLFVNGVPAVTTNYNVWNNTVQLAQGSAPVANLSSVIFQVTYTKGSTYQISSPVIFLNHVGLSLGQVVLAIGLVAALGALVVYALATKRDSDLLEVGFGFVGLAALVWGWMAI